VWYKRQTLWGCNKALYTGFLLIYSSFELEKEELN
jgi:hypothetical protein